MEGHRFRKMGGFLRSVFGEKVFKVGLRGGFTCPNRDGRLDTAGCIFCNPASSMPLGFTEGMTLAEQLEHGTSYITDRHGSHLFLAYFQDFTTTYCDPDRLRGLLLEALAFPGVVGAALCTRPDCLEDPMLDMLEEISASHFLWVEVGAQSSEDPVLLQVNRCHDAACSVDAFRRLHSRGMLTSAHMVLGLPGSGPDSIRADAYFVREAGAAGLKLQNLHVVSGTRLEEIYRAGKLELMSLENYANGVADFLELTDPGVVIQRISGEAPRGLTVAPDWSVNKLAVVNEIHRVMEYRDTWQGRLLGFPRSALGEPASGGRLSPDSSSDIAPEEPRE